MKFCSRWMWNETLSDLVNFPIDFFHDMCILAPTSNRILTEFIWISLLFFFHFCPNFWSVLYVTNKCKLEVLEYLVEYVPTCRFTQPGLMSSGSKSLQHASLRNAELQYFCYSFRRKPLNLNGNIYIVFVYNAQSKCIFIKNHSRLLILVLECTAYTI